MILRSGFRRKLSYQDKILSSPLIEKYSTPVASISQQKQDQEALRAKHMMAEDIQAYSKCCETAEGKVNRIRHAIETAGQDYTKFGIHALKLYLKTVDAAYEEYNDYQNKIYLTDPSRKQEFEATFIEFEELYEFARIAICQMIEEHEEAKKAIELASASKMTMHIPASQNQPGSSAADSMMRYPPTIVLQQSALPNFDGKYENWYKFKQMFRDIADKCIADSAATKLHYLDKALVGRAQGAIDSQIIRDNDYEGAWRSLTEQFENLPALINATIMKLLSLKAMSGESFQQLKALVDEAEKCISSLEFHDLKMDKLSEALVTTLISSKLDLDTRKIWESTVKRGQLPVYKQMITVLRNQQHVLERCENAKVIQKARGPNPASRSPGASKAHAATIQNQKPNESCPLCMEKHPVEKCDAFKRSDVKGRYEKAKQLGLCFACLRKGHRTSDCKANVKCSKCLKRHNAMLHPEDKSAPENRPESPVVNKPSENCGNAPSTVAKCLVQCNAAESPKQVLLATAVVFVFDSSGNQHKCRVLLDSGAMVNFASQRLVDLLRLNKRSVNVPVVGVNGMRTLVKFQVHMKVKSRISDDDFCLDYLVVPRVTGALPAVKLNVEGWPIPPGTSLADPTFFEPSRIDLLVGAEAFFDLLLTGKIKMSIELPVLQDSVLGWLVSGRVAGTSTVATVRACHATTNRDKDAELISVLKQFWAIDDQTIEPKRDDDDCERHFQETYERVADGRYVVRLPFRKDPRELGESRQQAEKRFYQLERRLEKTPEQKKLYSDFIKEYIDLGHCKLLTNSEREEEGGFYLPHHCVLRPESSSTKLRVVFDASSKSSSGQSLNDMMMVGPTVQDTLFEIMLRFRLHRYAFTADVPKMYRQVQVHKSDNKFQRILWRDDRSQPLQVIELTTVTYGTAAAPFLATRILNQLAVDEQNEFPRASKVVLKSFYVDDVLSGAATLDEAKQLQNELAALLERGGFELHKWCANDADLLQDIPLERREKQLDFQNHAVNETIKTLGLLWNPIDDNFSFSVKPFDKDFDKTTKRQVMSEIAKLFDPLGLLGPVVVLAKMIMQELWRCGLDWDTVLPAELLALWKKLRNELPEIATMKIPRRVTTDDVTHWEIHGFADASNKAVYVYLRNVRSDGTAELNLLCAKSRITPKKEAERHSGDDTNPGEMTMPRLELCAARLLAEMATKVKKALEINVDRIVLWSDSQIVLSWLEYLKPEAPIFVHNRVSQIRELTGRYEWKYVPTKENPADLISRGVYPRQLQKCQLWWSGPPFLRSHVPEPAVMFCDKIAANDPPEACSTVIESVAAVPVTTNRLMNVIMSCSNFRKLERIVGYVIRFIRNCKAPVGQRRCGRLSREDFTAAVHAMVRVVQKEVYREEINCTLSDKPVKGKLRNLNPVLEKGTRLLRVGGRLRHSDLPSNQRHPIILPERHHFTDLLIETYHREYLHVGLNGLLAALRRNFWPVNAKRLIHRVLRRCVRCFRVKPKETDQFMGDLPKSRVTAAQPFARTGVDYAGPVFPKQGRCKAPLKGYIAIFVCMCTKAIHIELVTSMSTDAFLAALHRFVGRRGNVSEMHSDNGTNFVGANRQLSELRALLRSQMLEQKAREFCQSRGINWNFNPPKAPHQGGLWEAGVKSAKYHLYRVTKECHFTYEEMNTLLVQIEAVLNSRPLYQQSDDPLDYEALSPGHFLIGRELTAIAEPLYDGIKENALSRYQLIQKRKQDFYKRWSNEYLAELQQRNKWNKTPSAIEKGWLVVLKEDNTPPQQWRLGRIVDTHPGKDGITRVVTVRTSSGEYRRPTTQVAILPILDNVVQTKQVEELSQAQGGSMLLPKVNKH